MQGGREAKRRSEASCWWGVQGGSSQDPWWSSQVTATRPHPAWRGEFLSSVSVCVRIM